MRKIVLGPVIIRPLSDASPVRKLRPVALVYGAHRRITIVTEDGIREHRNPRTIANALDGLKRSGHVIYSGGRIADLRFTTKAPEWLAHTWRRRAAKMIHRPTGAKVYPLRNALSPNPADAMGELLEVRDWLASYGVRCGSISATAGNLFRATLTKPIALRSNHNLTDPALFGGRQEARIRAHDDGSPKTYSRMMTVDIRRAYPTAMAAHPYAASFRRVSPETYLDPTIAGLAQASVVVPNDLPYPPLPVRVPFPGRRVVSYQQGRIRGIWAWCELAAARDLGCAIRVERVWAPRRVVDLFATWGQVASSADLLVTPGARRLAKAEANALWGRFAMRPVGAGYLTWADDLGREPIETDRVAHYPRDAVHVAAETTARVRRRLLLEGIYGAGDGVPIYADTDGLIVRVTRPVPSPAGDLPGQWRVKENMRTVEIRAPQLYRWTCGHGCGVTHRQWHYVASGVSGDEMAERLFHKRRPVEISYRVDFEPIIGPTHADDHERVSALADEALSMSDTE